MKSTIVIFLLVILVNSVNVFANDAVCNQSGVKVQVLGSGGPELTANRASSSYLIWLNDKANILLDAGGGSSLRYGQSKADWIDLKAVLFTHFHADHSSDFPALIKASWFGGRIENLPVFGPYANQYMPSTTQFLEGLFDIDNGAYKYLSDMYNDKNSDEYKLIPKVLQDNAKTQIIYKHDGMIIFAQKVKHGPIPAFAYVISICGKTIVFSGDTTGVGFENLKLDKTDLFIAHNAIPQGAGPVAKSLHMTPTQIGEIAKQLNTQKLIISHRMKRTLGKEQQTKQLIQKNYTGKIYFANDLDVFKIHNP